MDIGENVTAILCVIVGILIIGTALVPIVEHASQTEESETISGTNQGDGPYYTFITGVHTLKLDDGGTLDGHPITDGVTLMRSYDFLNTQGEPVCYVSPSEFVVIDDSTVSLTDGTATITPAQVVITGTDSDSNSYTQTVALTSTAMLYTQDESNLTSSVPSAQINSKDMAECTISDGQSMDLVYWGADDDGTIIPITTSTTSTPYEGVSLTKNSNGTVTVVISDNLPEGDYAVINGPLEWSQTVTTGTGASQYAALYGIIPIMCILGMGYVLIRRF